MSLVFKAMRIEIGHWFEKQKVNLTFWKGAFNSLTHSAKDSSSESGSAEQSTCQSRSTEIKRHWKVWFWNGFANKYAWK